MTEIQGTVMRGIFDYVVFKAGYYKEERGKIL